MENPLNQPASDNPFVCPKCGRILLTNNMLAHELTCEGRKDFSLRELSLRIPSPEGLIKGAKVQWVLSDPIDPIRVIGYNRSLQSVVDSNHTFIRRDGSVYSHAFLLPLLFGELWMFKYNMLNDFEYFAKLPATEKYHDHWNPILAELEKDLVREARAYGYAHELRFFTNPGYNELDDSVNNVDFGERYYTAIYGDCEYSVRDFDDIPEVHDGLDDADEEPEYPNPNEDVDVDEIISQLITDGYLL